jgi:hypothetical protein
MGIGVGVSVADSVGAEVGGMGVGMDVGSAGAPPHPVSNNAISVKPNARCNNSLPGIFLLLSLLLEIMSAWFILISCV